MRWFLVAVCLSSVLSIAQTSSSVATAASAVQQDATARQVLQQAVQAMAVSPDAVGYRNFSVTGTILLEGSTSSEPVKVLERGLYDVRFEITHQDGTSHVAVMRQDGNNGLRDEKGHIIKIDRNRRAGTEVPLLLLPGTLSDMLASAGSIRDLGMDTVNGRAAHHVSLAPQFPSDLDPDGLMTTRSTIDFFVDAENFLILKIAHTAADQTGRRSIERSVSFADFRAVAGVTVPFSITEALGDQKTWSITVTSIDLTKAMLDRDFQL